MNRHISILVFTIFSIISCQVKDEEILPIQENHYAKSKITLVGDYKTKPPKGLFYTDREISLHSDSTFTYIAYTCIGVDSCYGSWTFSNDTVLLKTGNELRKEIAHRTILDRLRLVDLNDYNILVKPQYLLLRIYNNSSDTLLKK